LPELSEQDRDLRQSEALLDGDLVRLRIDSEQQLALLDALIVANNDFGHLETLALIETFAARTKPWLGSRHNLREAGRGARYALSGSVSCCQR
jgi:hypothetical protein